jgi:hypothetical protein
MVDGSKHADLLAQQTGCACVWQQLAGRASPQTAERLG